MPNIVKRVREAFLLLNLFKTRLTDPWTLRVQRWSTRIYLGVLFCGLIIFLTYTLSSKKTITVTIDKPSLSTYLNLYQSSFSNTLKCPCSNIAIEHQEFNQINITFHPVCSSQYVTDDTLRSTLFQTGFSKRTDYQNIWPMDVHKALTPFLALLSSFCRLSAIAVDDAIHTFATSSQTTSEVLPPDMFYLQTSASVIQMKEQAPFALLQLLNIIHAITVNNQIVSGWSTNYFFKLFANVFYTNSYSISSDNQQWCACSSIQKCPVPISIYEYSTWDTLGYYNLTELKANKTLPGLFTDCLPVDGFLISSLSCFYNSSCIEMLQTAFNTSILPRLDETLLKSFRSNDTIQILLNQLFVDTWQNTSSYSSYYTKCAPLYCVYSFSQRQGVLYICTAILSVIGGLITILRFIVPLMVKCVMKCVMKQGNDTTVEEQNRIPIIEQYSFAYIRFSIRTKMASMWKALIELNLFEANSANVVRDLRLARISTRIYLFFFSISIIVLVIYISLDTQLKRITIEKPTLTMYGELNEKYRNTLVCPCSQISVKNGQFLQMNFTLHPICSSNIFSLKWDPLTDKTSLWYSYVDDGFRTRIISHLNLIENFCSLVRVIIDEGLISFFAEESINTQLIDHVSFESQTISSVNEFVLKLNTDFVTSNGIINDINQATQSLAVSMVDFYMYPSHEQNDMIVVYISGLLQKSPLCYCFKNRSCISNEYLKLNWPFPTPIWYVPGLVIACTRFDSVLLSTLECWFDHDCVQQIVTILLNRTIIDDNDTLLLTLDRNSTSQFSLNTSFETLLNYMLVEAWENKSSYASFYSQCAPSSCSYSIIEKTNVLYRLVTIISICSGLSAVLRFVVPLVVGVILKCIRRRHLHDPSRQAIDRIPLGTRLLLLLRKTITMIVSTNLFHKTSSTAETLHFERVTTRWYLALLVSSLCIFTIYTTLEKNTYVITVQSPTVAIYERLQILYSTSLYCPCSTVIIEYNKFLTVNASLHPICDSTFAIEDRMNPLLVAIDASYYENSGAVNDDFRTRSLSFFGMISFLCKQARHIIDTEIKKFARKKLVTAQPFSRMDFESRISLLLFGLHSTTPLNFVRTLQLIRETNLGNGLMDKYLTGWYYHPYFPIKHEYSNNPSSRQYGNCFCAVSYDCIIPASIECINIQNEVSQFLPMGLIMGCNAFESLLHSSFECLFDEQCVELLWMALVDQYCDGWPASDRSIFAMDPNSTLFSLNASGESILNRMMVEQWSNTSSYEHFYTACAPIQCSYTQTTNANWFYIITALIGFYSGVNISLRFLLPICLKISVNILKYIKQRYFRRIQI